MTESKEMIFEKPTTVSRSVKCQKCHGNGYVIVYRSTPDTVEVYGDGTKVAFADTCPICGGVKDRRVEQVKATSEIPEKFREVRMEQFKWDIYRNEKGELEDLSKHKSVIEDLVGNYTEWESNGMGLYIWSERKGSGKTMLACCIANAIMGMYGKNVRFLSAPSLLDILAKKEQFDRDPLETFKRQRILIIDDLGAEQQDNAWFADSLYKIIDARMNNKLITIITSNVRKDRLPYDERTVDRINSVCIPIRLPQFSVRNEETSAKRKEFLKERGLL